MPYGCERIVVIGSRGEIAINARFAMNKNANILGMALNHATPSERAGIHAALVEGLRNGSLRPVIAQERKKPDVATYFGSGKVAELKATKIPERAGRALDHETEDAFERLRVAGYL